MNSSRHIPPSPGGPAPRGSWLEASLACLPHFLFGLNAGLPALLKAIGIDASFEVLQIALNTLFGLASLTSLIILLRLGRPRWIAAWYLYWILTGFYLIARFWPGVPSWLEPYLWTIWPIIQPLFFLCIGYLLYRIAARDRLRAIVTAVPAMLGLWSINVVLVPRATSNRQPGLLTAGWADLHSRRAPQPSRARTGDGHGDDRPGGPHVYFPGNLSGWNPALYRAVPEFARSMELLIPQFGATAAMTIGPQLAVTLRELGRRNLPAGKPAYRLALAGLLLSLVMVVFVVISIIDSNWLMSSPLPSYNVFIQIIFLSGMLIYVVGYLSAVFAMRRGPRALPNPLLELLLFAALPGVPLALTGVFSSLGPGQMLFGWILDGLHLSESLWKHLTVHLSFLWVLLSISTAIAWMKQLRSE